MIRPVTSVLSRSAFCAAALLAIAACSQSSDATEPLGQIDLSLTGRAPSGTIYRLRDAQLAIRPTGQVFDTEDDPDRAVLSIRLDPGSYALDLLDGWRLERLDANGAVTVPATLLSPDPQPFAIVSDEITALSLRFHVEGGDVGTGPGGLDVSLEIDETPSTPDAGVPGGTFQYVARRIELPTGNDTRLKLDIDGDGRTENKLGAIIAALTQQSAGSLDLQGDLDRGVARGVSILLAELRADSLGSSAEAFLGTFQGTSPDPAPCAGPDDELCGGHLRGTATFVAAADGRGAVDGAISSGQLTGGPGAMQLLLPFTATPLALDLIGVRVRMTDLSPTAIGDGIIGGAISSQAIQTQVIPWITDLIGTIVARDCSGGPPPVCGCAAGSTGRTLLGLFDKMPVDCSVTLTEVATSPFIRTLLAPDLDLLPPFGDRDSLSVGFGVTAVGARFTE